MNAGRQDRLRYAVNAVCSEIEARRPEQPCSPTPLSEEELWWELTACILGSTVRYEQAFSALSRLQKANLAPWHTRTQDYHILLQEELSRKGPGPYGNYPFARVRASYIAKTARRLYEDGPGLTELIRAACSPRKTRETLVRTIVGIGPKQASLFLRNAGFRNDFAVLDTHVLEFMYHVGLLDSRIRTVSTLQAYERLEDRFKDDAEANGFGVGDYDVAVWVVMRVFKGERHNEPCNLGLGRHRLDSDGCLGQGRRDQAVPDFH